MNAVLVSTIYQRNEYAKAKLQRRILRDHSNPLDMGDSTFLQNYRINKDAFRNILHCVKLRLPKSSIPAEVQLAATLRFLAEGGFQRGVGKDSNVALARSTICKILNRVLIVLEKCICPRWIKLEMTVDEQNLSKRHFMQEFGIPGVVGCIDGTHVEITKPQTDGNLFYNRKGYYSLNAMIICDYNMVIKAVDACRPGSSHDSLIWSVSKPCIYFTRCYYNGDRGSWLLGDAGYALQPFLLTPYRDPQAGTRQHNFNRRHASARNVVERTIGVLKSRFRCLSKILPYQPLKAIRIINVCCALHNLCRHFNVEYLEEANIRNENDDGNDDWDELIINSVASSIRDEIANRL